MTSVGLRLPEGEGRSALGVRPSNPDGSDYSDELLGAGPRLVYVVNLRIPSENAHAVHVSRMCESFARQGCEVTLFHPYRKQPKPVPDLFEYYDLDRTFAVRTLPNVDVVKWEKLPQPLYLAAFFLHGLLWGLYAARIAKRQKADLYYTTDINIAYSLTRLGLPTVLDLHIVPKRAHRWLLRRVARKPELRLVVTVTSFMKEEIRKIGVGPERILVRGNGVDLDVFAAAQSREECRCRLGLPLGRPIVGYIGRFRAMGAEKGIRELVHALARLDAVDGEEPLLLCVGGPMDAVPTYLAEARRLGIDEDRLRFVDRVPHAQVPLWIRACDVAVVPSPPTEYLSYFSCPQKLYEYLAAGTPVVASDLPAIGEIVEHGRSGWLVSPGSSQALAEGIRAVLADPSRARLMATNAVEFARSNTWDHRAVAILSRVTAFSHAP